MKVTWTQNVRKLRSVCDRMLCFYLSFTFLLSVALVCLSRTVQHCKGLKPNKGYSAERPPVFMGGFISHRDHIVCVCVCVNVPLASSLMYWLCLDLFVNAHKVLMDCVNSHRHTLRTQTSSLSGNNPFAYILHHFCKHCFGSIHSCFCFQCAAVMFKCPHKHCIR